MAENKSSLKTDTTYPNAGVEIPLSPQCIDCSNGDGEIGVDMAAVGFDDLLEQGILFECPVCGKEIAVGTYANPGISQRDAGDITKKDAGRLYE